MKAIMKKWRENTAKKKKIDNESEEENDRSVVCENVSS